MTETLGETLRRRRDDLGLTRREVAERAGISTPTIQTIEGSSAPPVTLRSLASLAAALDLQLVIKLVPVPSKEGAADVGVVGG